MIHDQLRDAMRSDDLVAWDRAVHRAPTEQLASVRAQLELEKRILEQRIRAIDVEAPRCRCGAISTGTCGSCLELEKRADALLVYWKAHPVWERWMNGSRELETDALKFAKAWCAAYHYATDDAFPNCFFPGCRSLWYCPDHQWMNCQKPKLSKFKVRSG